MRRTCARVPTAPSPIRVLLRVHSPQLQLPLTIPLLLTRTRKSKTSTACLCAHPGRGRFRACMISSARRGRNAGRVPLANIQMVMGWVMGLEAGKRRGRELEMMCCLMRTRLGVLCRTGGKILRLLRTPMHQTDQVVADEMGWIISHGSWVVRFPSCYSGNWSALHI